MTGREEELEQRCPVSKGFFLTFDESTLWLETGASSLSETMVPLRPCEMRRKFSALYCSSSPHSLLWPRQAAA